MSEEKTIRWFKFCMIDDDCSDQCPYWDGSFSVVKNCRKNLAKDVNSLLEKYESGEESETNSQSSLIKHIVFISVPMSGYPDDIVLQEIEAAKRAYLNITGQDIRQVAFVHNLDAGKLGKPENLKNESIWYLAQALKKLADCDMAFFWNGWETAMGCQIEHTVCETYGIPTISVNCNDWR